MRPAFSLSAFAKALPAAALAALAALGFPDGARAGPAPGPGSPKEQAKPSEKDFHKIVPELSDEELKQQEETKAKFAALFGPAPARPAVCCPGGATLIVGPQAAAAALADAKKLEASGACDATSPLCLAPYALRDWNDKAPGAVWIETAKNQKACNWHLPPKFPEFLPWIAAKSGIKNAAAFSVAFTKAHEQRHCAYDPQNYERDSIARAETDADYHALLALRARYPGKMQALAQNIFAWRLYGWLAGDKSHPPGKRIADVAMGLRAPQILASPDQNPDELDLEALSPALLHMSMARIRGRQPDPEKMRMLGAALQKRGYPPQALANAMDLIRKGDESFAPADPSMQAASARSEERRWRAALRACASAAKDPNPSCAALAQSLLVAKGPQSLRENDLSAAFRDWRAGSALARLHAPGQALAWETVFAVAGVAYGKDKLPMDKAFYTRLLGSWCSSKGSQAPFPASAAPALGAEDRDCEDLERAAGEGMDIWLGSRALGEPPAGPILP